MQKCIQIFYHVDMGDTFQNKPQFSDTIRKIQAYDYIKFKILMKKR